MFSNGENTVIVTFYFYFEYQHDRIIVTCSKK